MKARYLACIACVGALQACDGNVGGNGETQGGREGSATVGGSTGIGGAEPSPSEASEPEPLLSDLSTEEVRAYLAKLAPPWVARVLTVEEREAIDSKAGDAIEAILLAWTKEDAFARAARTLIDQRLSVSGTKDDIDFNLPGNIVEHVVRHDRPWSEILTSENCYDADDGAIACDSGAPFTAGVLTTRGYLASRASRFNLTRASTMIRSFACRTYPLEDSLQPRVPKEDLIPMFRAMTPEEQTEEKAKSGFGNGLACYSCHGQFGAHAQLFVKFDQDGLWQADATGVQDEDGELGRSFNGLMASHMNDPARKASEESQIFGEPVKNLADAARVLSESPTFLACAARNALDYGLDVNPSIDVDPALLDRIAAGLVERSASPTFAEIFVATFTSPYVAAFTVQSTVGDEP